MRTWLSGAIFRHFSQNNFSKYRQGTSLLEFVCSEVPIVRCHHFENVVDLTATSVFDHNFKFTILNLYLLKFYIVRCWGVHNEVSSHKMMFENFDLSPFFLLVGGSKVIHHKTFLCGGSKWTTKSDPPMFVQNRAKFEVDRSSLKISKFFEGWGVLNDVIMAAILNFSI